MSTAVVKRSKKPRKPAVTVTEVVKARPKTAPVARQSKSQSAVSSGLGAAVTGLGPTKPNRSTMGMMRDKLTQPDAGIAAYMLGLTTPTAPCRPPWVLGDFELDTNTYSYVFNGVVTCTSAGFGYVGAVPDSWSEVSDDGGPAYKYCAYTTGGKPVWYTPAGSAATVTAPVASSDTGTHTGVTLPKLDPGFVATSRFRNTAIIMSIWPDSPAQTTQGDITIAMATSEEALANGALNNVNFTNLVGFPQEYVSHFELPLANWDASKAAHAVAVPFTEACFTFNYMPATGQTTTGGFLMVACITGAAASQTLRWRIEYKYETTAPTTYQTGLTPMIGMRSPVPKETLIPHLGALRPLALSHVNPEALSAKGMLAIKKADPSLFDRVVSGIGAAAPALAGLVQKAVSKIPILNAAFSAVRGFFN